MRRLAPLFLIVAVPLASIASIPSAAVAQPRERPTVTIKTLTGSEYKVPAAARMTVAQLKEATQQKTGVMAEQQRLIFEGRELEDDKTLIESGLKPGSEIFLIIRLRSDD